MISPAPELSASTALLVATADLSNLHICEIQFDEYRFRSSKDACQYLNPLHHDVRAGF